MEKVKEIKKQNAITVNKQLKVSIITEDETSTKLPVTV
jgi:hypothetical protein